MIKTIMLSFEKIRAHFLYMKIKKHIKQNQKVLDFGSGSCALNHIIKKKKNATVTATDIKDNSLIKNISPKIIKPLKKGDELPFNDKEYNIGTIITVLHHADCHNSILNEMKRICNQIIIIEDVFNNKIEEKITHFLDAFFNFHFKSHPHSNKNHKMWIKTFKNRNLKLIYTREFRFFFFRQRIYILNSC